MHTAVAILCLALCWATTRVDQAVAQRTAILRIEELGGTFYYDEEWTAFRSRQEMRRIATPILPGIGDCPLVRDFHHDVTSVSLSETAVTNDDLRLIASLKALDDLNLSQTQITGEGLANIETLPRLRNLMLWRTPIDDLALMHIRELRNLESLALDETAISDEGLIHLENLTSLKGRLGLTRTKITDLGLERLTRLDKLRNLDLTGTSVTSQGIATLQQSLKWTEIQPEK